MIDPDNPVVKLCLAGASAEFRGQSEEACRYYQQAWQAANDDYEACIAAHYLARCQPDPEQRLHWNRVALDKANAAADESVAEFYPSLYLNMGQSYDLLGKSEEAQRYYDLAAGLGVLHQE